MPGQRTLIDQAIEDNIRTTYLTRQSSQLGTISPAFKAIFKSDAQIEFITDIFKKLSTIPRSGSRERPHFICIRTQAEAQQYETGLLQLWQKCTANTGPQGLLSGRLYFLCPRFFNSQRRYPSRKTGTLPWLFRQTSLLITRKNWSSYL